MTENMHHKIFDSSANFFQKGLSAAKNSFEMILKSPVNLEEVNYKHSEFDMSGIVGEDKFHVIKTELHGDLDGASFLIFSEVEIDKIIKSCLPENFWGTDTDDAKKMRSEFINEIDNIMSSSVITEMANDLDIFLYGGVPQPDELSAAGMNTFLQEQSAKFNKFFQFKASFSGVELGIAPRFIWMFNEQLEDKISE